MSKPRGLLLLMLAGCSAESLPAAQPWSIGPTVAVRQPQPTTYRRRDWRHWVDADHDCQDTREEVLIAESEVPVDFVDERGCKVKRGRWTCPYTGVVVTDPADLDVDHVVPLENAHSSGGWHWSPERKRAFANDLKHPEHLIAVLARANRQKGSKGPERWMPTNAAFRCDYIRAWTGIKARWDLSETQDEVAAIEIEMAACDARRQ